MPTPEISAPDTADGRKVIDLITLAFASDPLARWLWPESDVYLEAMPKFVAGFGGQTILDGTALIADGFTGVALWMAPGTEPDEASVGAVLETYTRKSIASEMVDVFEQMAAHHPLEQPCWYLPMIGADPGHRGTGLGDALLRIGLERCDAQAAAAYLEASNPRGIPLYRRHGFEVIGEVQIGSSPTIYPMLREPMGL